jgi:glutamate racemase
MAIGVFDSGIGGLSVHRELVSRLPDADFVYLADQAMTPYGGRPGEEIVALTRAGCERLFAQGCDLVILACNTAAAVALRRLQQTWLPGYRKEVARAVNVLGIIVPTIEAATGLPWEQEAAHKGEKIERLEVLGIFCTPATAVSRVYEIEIDKRRQDVAVFCEVCPTLAGDIEADAAPVDLARTIERHVASLTRRIGRPPDRAILGCTHYEITADLFRAALPHGTPLIHQPDATAAAVGLYLSRHPQYDPGHGGGRRFLTTGQGGRQNGLAERFWGGPLTFEVI